MTKWAFLVGISNYVHEGFNNLDFADRHVTGLAEILRDSNEYTAVILLNTDDLYQNKPTRNSLMSKFDRLLKRINPKDTLIIFFVCHGGFYKGKNLIFPQNADKSDTDILIDTSISIDWFVARLGRYESEAWNVFFIIDACREQIPKSMSVGELDSQFRISEYKEIDKYPSGISFFFSCSSKQKAWQFKKNDDTHSIFSYALLKGLKNGISPPITYWKLIEYTKTKVAKLIKKYGTNEQTPRDQSSLEAYKIILLKLESEETEETTKSFEPLKISNLLEEYHNTQNKNKKSEIIQVAFSYGPPAMEYFFSIYRGGNEEMKNTSGAILNEWNPDWKKDYDQRYMTEFIPPYSTTPSIVAKIYPEPKSASLKIDALINLLEKYDGIRNEPERESTSVKVLGNLLDNNHSKLQNLGFGIHDSGDTIKDENFQIHLTRYAANGQIHQFLIRRLNNGNIISPDEVYFSFGYPEFLKERNDISVISDFKTYLRKKFINEKIRTITKIW